MTTRNFHIFQVDINFDQTGTMLYHKISKVFYQYGFYQTSNYIKTFDGYFAVAQKLPINMEPIDKYSRQVLTVYDTRERWRPMQEENPSANNTVPGYYMLGGMPLPKGRVSFDFNFTFRRNSTDPFRDIGLLVLNAREAVIREVALHDHIEIVTQAGISETQNGKFKAFSDFSKFEIPLNVIIQGEGAGLPGWAIALIVIGSVALAGLGGFVGWRLYLKKRAQSTEEAPIKKSLLEKEG